MILICCNYYYFDDNFLHLERSHHYSKRNWWIKIILLKMNIYSRWTTYDTITMLLKAKILITISQKQTIDLIKLICMISLHDDIIRIWMSFWTELNLIQSASTTKRMHQAKSWHHHLGFSLFSLIHFNVTSFVISNISFSFFFSFLIFFSFLFLFYCILHPNSIFLILDSQHSLELFVHLFLLQISFSCFILGKIRILIIIQQHIDHDTLSWFTQVLHTNLYFQIEVRDCFSNYSFHIIFNI